MSKYLSIYKDSPTSGGTDGTQVSEGGTFTSPITANLDASKAESTIVKLAARCASGYKTTTGGVTIKISGSHTDRYQLCYSSSYTGSDTPATSLFGDSCTLPQTADTNVVFWVMISSTTDETPQNDTDDSLSVSAQIIAADES